MVGRRGEAPLVPPYKPPCLKIALVLPLRRDRLPVHQHVVYDEELGLLAAQTMT